MYDMLSFVTSKWIDEAYLDIQYRYSKRQNQYHFRLEKLTAKRF